MFAGTHTIQGFNYADVWHWQFLLAGGVMIALGIGVLGRLGIRGKELVFTGAVAVIE